MPTGPLGWMWFVLFIFFGYVLVCVIAAVISYIWHGIRTGSWKR